MYLKSLTLKGFKSFASATTLRFEPGITCVVGPNGSGKSNVVDALTWVMGEQGAKALRGGKMEDVIFAGTSGRAPLGRAEVTLTIDNSDGALPIDYSEVSITRRMFRDGAGEYEINGSSCRLMDVQELLSDSGIGREMHVIVGQGRLAAILESRPEDRRAFIEEAAGVLKHRKRKEKAVRKLDAMQANLARLTDLTTELRRQLKPLGRQAEVARRAQTVQADLRDARLRLAADDLVARREEFANQTQDEEAAREQYAMVQDALEAGTVALAEHEQAVARLTPSAEAAGQTWFRLSALAERVNATVRIAHERARHLDSVQSAGRGQDPDELEAQAERVADLLLHRADGRGLVQLAPTPQEVVGVDVAQDQVGVGDGGQPKKRWNSSKPWRWRGKPSKRPANSWPNESRRLRLRNGRTWRPCVRWPIAGRALHACPGGSILSGPRSNRSTPRWHACRWPSTRPVNGARRPSASSRACRTRSVPSTPAN